MSTTNTKLGSKDADPVLLKEVLQIVESSGQERSEINGIEALCFKGDYENFFPKDKRLPLRRKWDNLRRQKIENYHQFLLDIGVNPGPATLKELREDRETNFFDNNDDDESLISNALESLELTPPRETARVRSTRISFTTPKPPPAPTSSYSPMTDSSHHHQQAESASGLSSAASDTLSAAASLQLVEGTKLNPFKFRVHRRFPEKNPARIFFARVPNYQHAGYEHTVWVAALTIPLSDFSNWEAYFHPPNRILFKGPSRSHWEVPETLWEPECHDVKNKRINPFPVQPAIEKAHKAIDVAIDKHPERQENWWEAEIPKAKDDDPDVVLDNTVFSGISETITKEPRKLKSLKHPDLKGLVVVWKIAEAGGIQNEKATGRLKDVQSLLDM